MMIKVIKNHFIYLIPVSTLAALIVMLHTTSPLKMGPAGILLVFILLYLFIASLFYILLSAIILLVGRFTPRYQSIKKQRLYYITSIIALGPVFLLALNSIGQLDIEDLILVTLLVGVSCFYVSRRF
jgi:hypothetical protein